MGSSYGVQLFLCGFLMKANFEARFRGETRHPPRDNEVGLVEEVDALMVAWLVKRPMFAKNG